MLLENESYDWLKIPKENLVDAVVIWYTLPNRTRLFGALVLGVYEGNILKYYGHAINVPENKEKEEIYHKLKQLEIDHPPIQEIPKSVIQRGVKWLRPKLVCEVNYGQIMRSGKLRRAYYRRLRDDVDPREIE
jgi:bifunctional non-homologous end joining protein LigD